MSPPKRRGTAGGGTEPGREEDSREEARPTWEGREEAGSPSSLLFRSSAQPTACSIPLVITLHEYYNKEFFHTSNLVVVGPSRSSDICPHY
jgi:hypothetical protein